MFPKISWFKNTWEYKFIKKIEIRVTKIIKIFLFSNLLSKSNIKGNNINSGNLTNKKDLINNIKSGLWIKRFNEIKKIKIKKMLKIINRFNFNLIIKIKN